MLASRVRMGSYREDEYSMENFYLAKDSDFAEVSGKLHYIGKPLYVEVPYSINGVTLTNVDRMFSLYYNLTTMGIKAVKMNNPNITSADSCFARQITDDLDLTQFNTTSIVNPTNIFSQVRVGNLNVFNWDVTNFNTNNGIFAFFDSDTLDISMWDINPNANMFGFVRDTTLNTLYVKNETIKQAIEGSFGKPSTLKVVVKS